MNKEIKVSVILPTYNGEKYIKRAINSVLDQTYTNWELLVIDDGSIDNTENIVKEYLMNDSRIICLKNESNLGIQKTLNRGLREAKGEYIARIDDDDIWIDKDKLKKQVEFLNKNRKYFLVGIGGVIVIDEEGKELFRYLLPDTDEKIRNKILIKNCFCHTGTVFRKEAALSCGGYSETEETKHIEDYDLWLKMGLTANFYNIPIYGLKHTMNKNSISLNNKLEQFKKSIILSKKYKNKYPGFVQAYIGKNLIVIFYGLFDIFFPGRIKNMIHKIYKNL